MKLLRNSVLAVAVLAVAACTIGPDYHRPAVELPTHFKEGVNWQRSAANPQGTLSSQWWQDFRDDQLTQLVEQSLRANQSIVAAEAAYRLAQAQVAASTASLYPVVTANAAASRSHTNSTSSTGTVATRGAASTSGTGNVFSATLAASWEPDLWGQIRRTIESAKENAQATDAQLAGERLSIAATVATDYLALRQFDFDIVSLEQQQQVDQKLLDLTRASYQQGIASNDSLLLAEDTLEAVVANLQTAKISREQNEHAIAVLVGVPPANFTIAPQPRYLFRLPDVPLTLPSTLLERRPDVVAAERMAAAANAKIGVAKAAFFPTLDLTASGGYANSTLAHLFSLPNRIWTLGPSLAETLFDAGARTAAVHEAEATYDQQVAMYRVTVLGAFQNVEDSLSSVNHLNEQARAFERIYKGNVKLYDSVKAQLAAGTASQQSLLTQQLTLLTAEQGARDAQAQAAQSMVTLIRNLGGGWQEADTADTAHAARGVAASSSGQGAGAGRKD